MIISLLKRVYCKYHYTEGHEFATPEDELVHFLKLITKERNFTWPPNQYGEFDFTLEDVDDEEGKSSTLVDVEL